MKPHFICIDPMEFYREGIRNMSDLVVLAHLGRCGLAGSFRAEMSRLLNIPYETVRSATDRLEDGRLVCVASRDSGQGLPARYRVTAAGWALLAAPPNMEQLAMEI